MRYEFATAQRIIVGPGTSTELVGSAGAHGRRAMLVTGSGTAARGGRAAAIAEALAEAGLIVASYAIAGEPYIGGVEEGARRARGAGCDLVIGIGGGSVLDTAKAIAALATNDGGALEYMEVVGAGKPLARAALPLIAVPTTAGTGSEVTRNAVIAAPEQRAKASIRHPSLLPRLALVDSTLTHDLPPHLTASSGLDALTQLIEPYVSRRSQPIADGLCMEGLSRAAWALRRVYYAPEDVVAREAMSSASLLSGMALANAGLGAVHGIAAPLGGAYPAPHGAACAALLPHVTSVNLRALRRRHPDGPALARYARLAAVLVRPGAAPDDLVVALRELVAELRIPKLATYGLTEAGIPELAAAAAQASSTRANPIDLELSEIEEAIGAAL
ncbi:MAG TPA: iron-containing alcohol dehydrogenase [Roseiflexaceae bacterium]|nr:iron-containing alcohol dehydrogenase [Roseiflexaceae bacterium]